MFQPDALILDLQMPGMDGFQIAGEVRQRYATYRPLLIAITGVYNKGRDALRSHSVGFDHQLSKPCNPDELLYLLSPLMRKRR